MTRRQLSIAAKRLRGAVEFGNVLVVVLVGCGVLAWWWQTRTERQAPRAQSSYAAGTTMGPLESDTNRRGRDLSDTGIRLGTAAECARVCLVTEACQAMSFSKKTGDEGTGICWLKGSVPESAENASMISAVKLQPAP